MNYRRELFPDLQYSAYINHASVSPLNARAMAAMNRLMRRYAQVGVKAWGESVACRDRLREKLAALIGASAGDIGLVSNTSQGLQIVAQEYPWRSGDRLVLFRGEFPGNVVPWLQAAERFGLEPIWLDLDDLAERSPAFQDAMARKPRLLAISWVQYQTGRTQSMAALSRLRDEFGVHLCVDAIQGLGPRTLDLAETPVDFIACGGHKWLMSPEGVGFMYIHPDRIGEMNPVLAGWLSQESPIDFLVEGGGLVDYRKPMRRSADRVEAATLNSFGFAGMEASIDLFLEIGPAWIEERVGALVRLCREGLRELGAPLCDRDVDAGIVSFKPPAEFMKRYARGLERRGVIVATPDGHVRASPHFYNDENDVARFLDGVRDLRLEIEGR